MDIEVVNFISSDLMKIITFVLGFVDICLMYYVFGTSYHLVELLLYANLTACIMRLHQ